MSSSLVRLAKTLSLVFNPLVFATFLCALFFWGHGASWARYLLPTWALLVALPTLLLVVGIRLGYWSDLDISHLHERRTYMPLASLLASGSVVLAFVDHFPLAIRLSVLAILFWLIISTLVSLFWKLSLHVGAAVGTIALIGYIFGPDRAYDLLWLPPVLGWARIRLRAHDPWQVLGGALAGLLAVSLAMAVVS